jgi:hydroxyethylthiazole kinase-like uncharacterized protein yjeF
MRPRPILTLAETRAAEAGSGVSDADLMEQAGAAVAEAAFRFGGGAPVLILCGPGNNGGDGYVAARLLAERGAAVRVAALRPPRAPAAVAAAERWSGPVETLAQAVSAPVVVDALFGTGLSRPLEDEPAASLARLVAAAKFSLAVDMPSGVSTDDGRLLGDPPRFDLTLALGALKLAHCLLPAAERCGRVLVGDIGLALPAERPLVEIAPPCLTPPAHGSDKYKRGKLLVVGGAMPGAGLMAATAGQHAGAGYVELLAGEGGNAPHSLVRRDWSQTAVSDKRIGAIAIGPGLGLDDQARDRLSAVLASAKPVVLDADALTLIGRTGHERLRGHVVTPHWGEFVRLFGDTGEGRLPQARAAAGATGAVVLLKGSDTIVAHPDGRAAINPLAPAWLASAGTGDVLTGIIGGLLAQGFDPFLAAQAGAWLHGEAGRTAGPFLIADDLIAALPAVMARCL